MMLTNEVFIPQKNLTFVAYFYAIKAMAIIITNRLYLEISVFDKKIFSEKNSQEKVSSWNDFPVVYAIMT